MLHRYKKMVTLAKFHWFLVCCQQCCDIFSISFSCDCTDSYRNDFACENSQPLVITFSFQQSPDFIVLSLILFCVMIGEFKGMSETQDCQSIELKTRVTTNSILCLYILHCFTVSDFWVGKKMPRFSFYFSQKNGRQVLLAALGTHVFSCKNWFHKRILWMARFLCGPFAHQVIQIPWFV